MAARAHAYRRDNEVKYYQLYGERLTYDRAAAIVVQEVARTEPALLRGWCELPGEV